MGMGRKPCCYREGLNRGAWTAEEDRILKAYVQTHGEGRWRSLSKKAGLKRCGKSCRLRWMNYLRPDIKRGNISFEEEDLIIRLHKLLGNKWSLIAGRLPGRTDNEIKNYWNTNLKKRVQENSQQAANDMNSLETKHKKYFEQPVSTSASALVAALGRSPPTEKTTSELVMSVRLTSQIVEPRNHESLSFGHQENEILPSIMSPHLTSQNVDPNNHVSSSFDHREDEIGVEPTELDVPDAKFFQQCDVELQNDSCGARVDCNNTKFMSSFNCYDEFDGGIFQDNADWDLGSLAALLSFDEGQIGF